MKILLWLILTICLLTSLIFSQEKLILAEQLKKGSQIIEKARKEIGVKDTPKSVYLSTKRESKIEKFNISEISEISLELPNKILLINSTKTPVESKDTSIWKGEEYKKFYEFVDAEGRRTITDATKPKNYDQLIKFAKNKGDKETVEKLEKMQKALPDPNKQINNYLWLRLFPLILSHPFEENMEFKYIGKSESAKRTALVVEAKSKNEREYRLFFDSETNSLLLMIEKYTFWDVEYETKYYYSNRDQFSGLLIPKNIKIELKVAPKGEETKIFYETIEILDFQLNPKLDEKMFEIK